MHVVVGTQKTGGMSGSPSSSDVADRPVVGTTDNAHRSRSLHLLTTSSSVSTVNRSAPAEFAGLPSRVAAPFHTAVGALRPPFAATVKTSTPIEHDAQRMLPNMSAIGGRTVPVSSSPFNACELSSVRMPTATSELPESEMRRFAVILSAGTPSRFVFTNECVAEYSADDQMGASAELVNIASDDDNQQSSMPPCDSSPIEKARGRRPSSVNDAEHSGAASIAGSIPLM